MRWKSLCLLGLLLNFAVLSQGSLIHPDDGPTDDGNLEVLLDEAVASDGLLQSLEASRSFYDEGSVKEGMRKLIQLLLHEPDSGVAWFEYLKRVESFFWGKAGATEIVWDSPVDNLKGELAFSLAEQLVEQGSWLKSLRMYLDALRRDGNNARYYTRFGEALVYLGYYELAEPFFAIVLHNDPADLDAIRSLRELKTELDRPERVRQQELLYRWVEQPGAILVATNLVAQYVALGPLSEALFWQEVVVNIEPKKAEHFVMMSQLLYQAEERLASVQVMDAAVQLDPNNPLWNFRAATIRREVQNASLEFKQKTAELAYAACEQTNFQKLEALVLYSFCQSDLGNVEAALRWGRRAQTEAEQTNTLMAQEFDDFLMQLEALQP